MGKNRIMKLLTGSRSALLIRFEPALSKWPPAGAKVRPPDGNSWPVRVLPLSKGMRKGIIETPPAARRDEANGVRRGGDRG